MNVQGGVIFKTENFSAGATVGSPVDLKIKTSKQISENRDYEKLFPAYNGTTWKLPLIIGVGFAYTGYKNFIFALDFEAYRFERSSAQLNLYEFGGQPNWKEVNILRAAVEFYQFRNRNLPIRFGYAYIPQLYASNNGWRAK